MTLSIKKVLISDKVDTSCQDVLKQNNIHVDYKPGLSKEELIEIIKDYNGLIVRSATKVTKEVLDHAKNLKIVGRAGTGVDNIDLQSASAKGVLVMNTPGGNTLSAAEHTCAMITALARHIGQGHASMVQGKWERSKFMGCELGGKTLAIIGLGRIGREVAARMQAYGMKTIGFDVFVSPEEAATFGVEYMQLNDIWPIADFVTVHVPLIKPTRGMINKAVFDICKPDMRVINVARGGIIDEKDLLDALEGGKCGGAALDVFETEPPKGVSMELVGHAKTLCTPHLGASTIEAQLRVAKEIAEQFVDAVNGKPMIGLVNAPALAEMGNPVFAPWVELAQKLGAYVADSSQQADNDKTTYNLSICGKEINKAGKLLATAAALGIASATEGLPPCNLINAQSVLKDFGSEIILCPMEEKLAYPAITISSKNGSHTGILIRGKPALSTMQGVELANPVVLDKGLVYTSFSSTTTKLELMTQAAGLKLDSISIAHRDGNQVALVAAGQEKPTDEIFRFLKF